MGRSAFSTAATLIMQEVEIRRFRLSGLPPRAADISCARRHLLRKKLPATRLQCRRHLFCVRRPTMSADPSCTHAQSRPSRREFLTAGTAGLVGASFLPAQLAGAPAQLAGARAGTPAEPQDLFGDGRKRRILLRGGVVLSLDPRVGDFEKADVLIDGKLIADVGPSISAPDAEVVDCSGTIVMPGFITTHHHQYETLQRSVIADGLLARAWPHEPYGSVVQNIWTAGRIPDPKNPNSFIWDLGRVPYAPEDCYISELVACLSEISEGITTGTDTSHANHTPEHTDH